MEYKVSVIIPVYGVEKFIERCVDTLMQQTLKEVEYIFVNDATPDHSMEILQDVLARYPERKDCVVVA
ncbi:glycosyltransferase [uncultured Bacteroides sp.]|uniref:glycosyltransferase family 2 protein n=1 Tax=uncultured Bacteroides sp. TaxID=162156 RepID=UPI00280B8FD0|nr:glycosyltransferase [uncultured Bacteroides sp.]